METHTTVTNLMFDLGGVVMDICRQRCVDAFNALGLADADRWFGDFGQQGVFADIERGAIDTDGFHTAVRALIGREVTDRQIDEAFCQFLTGIPKSRLEALRALRHRYGIYLLSNTNPVMWHSRIAREFAKIAGMTRDDYFDGTLTSFDARVLKPDAAIFELAASKFGIDPAKTLFLDDSADNCAAAVKCGYQALWIPEGTEFIDRLRQLNLA